ncbi:hypothetical protein [Streptacidiphilus sp. EB129]|uniref:hypothetical protein n=1 Tax=Streptacidiphilus sp. EB129 TaxID=3156262 RepID=UPI003512F025
MIDTDSNTVTATIPVGGNPSGVAAPRTACAPTLPTVTTRGSEWPGHGGCGSGVPPGIRGAVHVAGARGARGGAAVSRRGRGRGSGRGWRGSRWQWAGDGDSRSLPGGSGPAAAVGHRAEGSGGRRAVQAASWSRPRLCSRWKRGSALGQSGGRWLRVGSVQDVVIESETTELGPWRSGTVYFHLPEDD